jgi:hypothetical protein
MIATLRIIAAVVVAHPAMAVGITLVQETWFGGVGFHESSKPELAIAGLLTFLCAAAAGAIAAAIAGSRGRVAATIMSVLIIAESTWLITSGRASGPLWFDVLAASSLIVGILGGAEAVMRWRRGSLGDSEAGSDAGGDPAHAE